MDQPTETGAELTVDDAAKRIESLLGSDEPETSEAVEVSEVEAQESAETEEVSDDQEAEEVSESPSFQSVEELAEATGMDVETFLKQIKGRIKVDGEESEVTLEELRNGYQREADYRRKTMDLAERRKEFEATAERGNKELFNQHQQLSAMLGFFENQLTQEYQSVNWNELRVTDPGEFSAKLSEFQQRQAQLNYIKNNAVQQYQHLSQAQQKKLEETQNEFIRKEQSALLDKLPTWKDEAVASKERKEVSDFLRTEYGFTSDEIGKIADHRLVLLAKDAMSKREIKAAAEIAKKKVENIPKLLKPGVKLSKEEIKGKATSQKVARFKKTGSTDDLAAILFDRM